MYILGVRLVVSCFLRRSIAYFYLRVVVIFTRISLVCCRPSNRLRPSKPLSIPRHCSISLTSPDLRPRYRVVLFTLLATNLSMQVENSSKKQPTFDLSCLIFPAMAIPGSIPYVSFSLPWLFETSLPVTLYAPGNFTCAQFG
jgi:hypothetical protein